MTVSTSARTFNFRLRVLTILAALALLAGLPAIVPAQTLGSQLTIYSAPLVYPNPAFDSFAIVEFPFVFNRAELSFFRPDSTDTGYYSRVFAQVVLRNELNVSIDSTNTYFSIRVDSLKEASIPDFKLFNKLMLKTRPGKYTAHLTVIDAVSKKTKDMYFGTFIVPTLRKDKLKLSDPALAYKMQYVGDSAAVNQRMVRNGYLILNDPIGVFGKTDSTAYMYIEVYGLKTGPNASPKFRLACHLLDTASAVSRNYGYQMKEKPGTSAVITDALDITGIAPGRYSLQVVASDSTAGETDTARTPLIIFAPEAFARKTPADSGDGWEGLTLTEKINCTHWLLTPDQLETLGRLNDVGKENFLTQFWKENDIRLAEGARDNPSAAGTRKETVRRFKFANLRYSHDLSKTNGWNSDRGRIYIVYGPSDTHQDVLTPRVGNPFIIWNYLGYKGGKVFVFEDIHGDNDFRLVHSNVNGEPFSPSWDTLLQDESILRQIE